MLICPDARSRSGPDSRRRVYKEFIAIARQSVPSAGGNVFADLGFGPEVASALKARARRVIAEKLALATHDTATGKHSSQEKLRRSPTRS
jgi:hypothetical protein